MAGVARTAISTYVAVHVEGRVRLYGFVSPCGQGRRRWCPPRQPRWPRHRSRCAGPAVTVPRKYRSVVAGSAGACRASSMSVATVERARLGDRTSLRGWRRPAHRQRRWARPAADRRRRAWVLSERAFAGCSASAQLGVKPIRSLICRTWCLLPAFGCGASGHTTPGVSPWGTGRPRSARSAAGLG